jgi:hypothetical protein
METVWGEAGVVGAAEPEVFDEPELATGFGTVTM